MASTVKITARLFDQAGNPYHGVVKVDLVPGSGTVGQEIITNCVHVEQRIRDGVAVFNLVPNASIADDSYYAFELHEIATDAVYAPKPRLAWRKLAVVPNHDAVLSDIVIMQPIKPIPVAPAEQLVMQAQTAAGQAVAKATAAASSASAAAASAQTASGHASAASDSAGVASAKATEAGTKASDADASKIAAASSASSASAARDAAVSAAALADAKKTAAESAQASAESARDAASASAVTASSKASEASTSATSAASSASAAGIAKTAAESAQASAESARDAASASAVTASSKASEASTSATSAASSASAASESAASAVSAASQAAGTAIEAHNIASDAHADIRLSLNSGIATLSGRTSSAEKALKVAQRDIENLQAAAKGTLYTDITDDRTLHSKTLGDAEVCGSDTTVLPNGLLNSISGKTVVWNQMIRFQSFSRYGLIVTVNADGSIDITGTCNETPSYKHFAISISSTFKRDARKYVFYCNQEINRNWGLGGYPSWSGKTHIWNISSVGDWINPIYIMAEEGDTFDYHGLIFGCTDLTQLGMPDLTTDAFEALFDTSVYHPYNAGTLMSLPVKSVVTQGRNLLPTDYTFTSKVGSGVSITKNEDGSLFVNGTPSSNVQYTLLEDSLVLPKGTYKIYPQLLSGSVSSSSQFLLFSGGANYDLPYQNSNLANERTFTIDKKSSIGKLGIIAISGVTYTNAVIGLMIEQGNTKTGFKPYCRTSLDVPQSVKALTGYGWSAGSVCNEVDWQAKTYTQRVGKVDLGTLAWYYVTSSSVSPYFSAKVSDAKTVTNAAYNKANFSCGKYLTTLRVSSAFIDKCLCGDSDGTVEYFNIKDLSFTDATNFKNSVSGIIAYYELAEPIVTDISSLIDDNLLSNLETGGTVTFVSDGVAPDGTTVLTSDEQSLPVPSTIAYQTKIAS